MIHKIKLIIILILIIVGHSTQAFPQKPDHKAKQDLSVVFKFLDDIGKEKDPEKYFQKTKEWANGHGKNYPASVLKLYRNAAEKGHVLAMVEVGNMYNSGIGVRTNYTKALAWYLKAAELGDSFAQFNVGVAYSIGKGAQTDLVKAFLWFQKAAEQGDKKAQLNMGEAYFEGLGVKQDKNTAFTWYLKAAKQGNSNAQLMVARFYKEGIGIPMDLEKAKKWEQKVTNKKPTRPLQKYQVKDIKKTQEITITQKEIDDARANLSKIYTDIRAVPYFKGGKPHGIKILAVKRDSIFAKMGLKRSDIIMTIDGYLLDIASSMALFDTLKGKNNVKLVLNREGQAIKYTIVIKP